MPFELTKEYLDDLRKAIHSGRDRYLQELMEDLHPADISEVIYKLKITEANYLFKLLEGERAAEVLIELDEYDREKLLETLTSREIAEQLIDNIDSDDAADVLAELSDEKMEEVIAFITDEEQKSDISDRSNWTVHRTIRKTLSNQSIGSDIALRKHSSGRQ